MQKIKFLIEKHVLLKLNSLFFLYKAPSFKKDEIKNERKNRIYKNDRNCAKIETFNLIFNI